MAELGKSVLKGEGITKVFGYGKTRTVAVDHVDFDFREGEVISIVGESGSGKTTIARMILGLIGITEGSLEFNGQPRDISSGKKRKEYWKNIQAVFQDPFSSFNMFNKIDDLLLDCINMTGGKHLPKEKKDELMTEACSFVNLKYAELTNKYPFELSGGMQQRLNIALSIMFSPALLIMDEATTALDVVTQGQILDELMEMEKTMSITRLMITHDLSVVEHISDTVGVMYLGSLVEYGSTEDIFRHPLHPYTEALFSAIPIPDPKAKMNRIVLEGSIPSPANPPAGCKFHTRCAHCMERCKVEEPVQREVEPGHFVVCHLYDK